MNSSIVQPRQQRGLATGPGEPAWPQARSPSGVTAASHGYGGQVRTIRPAEESAVETTRIAARRALPANWLAAISGLLATAVVLGIVAATAGLGIAGWITGLAVGAAAAALLVTARMRSDEPSVHPADWVTLTRAVLIAGVAGLAADSLSRPAPITALVTLSAVALVLDAVDGLVARRTGTETPLGAR